MADPLRKPDPLDYATPAKRRRPLVWIIVGAVLLALVVMAFSYVAHHL